MDLLKMIDSLLKEKEVSNQQKAKLIQMKKLLLRGKRLLNE